MLIFLSLIAVTAVTFFNKNFDEYNTDGGVNG